MTHVYPDADRVDVLLAERLLGWKHNQAYSERDEKPWLDSEGNQRSWEEIPSLTSNVEGARTIRDRMTALGWELELGDPHWSDGEQKRIIRFSHSDGTSHGLGVPARDEAFPYFLGLVAYLALEKYEGREPTISF